MKEGKIELNTEFAKKLGFTSDNFTDDSYMWLFPKENVIYLSLIISKKKGAFKNLMQNIEKLGLKFKIPTPMGRMLEIGKKQGWKLKEEICDGNLFQYLTKEEK